MEGSSADKNTETNTLQLVQNSIMYSDTVHVEGTTVHGESTNTEDMKLATFDTEGMQHTDTSKDDVASFKGTKSKSELNECLLLLVSNTVNYMFNMDKDNTFSKELKCISINDDAIKKGKKGM